LKNIRIPGTEIFVAHIVDPVVERRICVAYATDRPLTRTARRVEVILRALLKFEAESGWWRFAVFNQSLLAFQACYVRWYRFRSLAHILSVPDEEAHLIEAIY
jgi:hypothetical protein